MQITARALMSSPVHTVPLHSTVVESQALFLRYGHSRLVVINDRAECVGLLARRDVDLALHHGLGQALVEDYMMTAEHTIGAATPLETIQLLMIKLGAKRLPVVEAGRLVGIVTQTDLLRYQYAFISNYEAHRHPITSIEIPPISFDQLTPFQQTFLHTAATVADQLEVRLFLVGGAVRDLLLKRHTDDLDLVVDGAYPTMAASQLGWGIQLGQHLHQYYPETRLDIHARFQTVALIWPDGSWIDIATARTEFYPYPAATPEVSLGSIQTDLYRRDFTINALALGLNGHYQGRILDFFGGLEDLKHQTIRVLHVNSFIEDPTRMYRAVRFAVRLGFQIDQQTQAYIERTMATGVHDGVGGDRLKHELRSILEEANWIEAFELLDQWRALRCLGPTLSWTVQSCQQMLRVGAWTYHFQRHYPEISHHDQWQLRIEALISQSQTAPTIARQLHLTQAGIERLMHLPSQLQQLQSLIDTNPEPGVIIDHLKSIKVQTVILLASLLMPKGRRLLFQYLSHWRLSKPVLSGHILKQMGYRPGPLFQTILHQVHRATLNGTIQTEEQAKIFVTHQFPLDSNS